MLARTLALTVLLAGALPLLAQATAEHDLDEAARRNLIAFVLVSEPGSAGIDEARSLVQKAVNQVRKSVLVEFDRGDPANAPLVARYRLSGAPVPLVLVIGRNGAVAGGFPSAGMSVANLVSAVPSPKKEEALLALQTGKSVFIVASPKGMSSRSAVDACSRACTRMIGMGVVVQIEMDDAAEAGFLNQLKIDTTSKIPVTLVVNAQGQVAGTFAGAADVAALVDTAKKKVGGCCPSTVAGSSKACPPPKAK